MKTIAFIGPEGRTITFSVTSVYEKIAASDKRVVINRGGTRSSKTYSLSQFFIKELFQGGGKVITVARKTWTSLRDTAMRDILEILYEHGLYEHVKHSKTERTIRYGTNMIEFVSMYDAYKVRGRKRTHLWLNEANECTYDDWMHLIFRTSGRAFLDFNPDDVNHWLNTEVELRRRADKGDVDVIVSTYKDNDFLNDELIKEVEFLGRGDPEYWKIYGMGEYGKVQGLVFPDYDVDEDIPPEAEHVAYGLDFGYSNSATALVEVKRLGDDIYVNELMYGTMMTNSDIIARLRELDIGRRDEIICDSADPKAVEELYRAGFNAKSAEKGKDSVVFSLDVLMRYKLHVTAGSVCMLKELRSYKWQTDKNGNVLNHPVNRLNHAIDALRYVALAHLQVETRGKYAIV
ncbi:MAG TPA: PBSX family phage terminase large subunit [Bacteroidia bacterium]|nr:PBSX family phage terminase large subunit [Bacteroidia bacterium]